MKCYLERVRVPSRGLGLLRTAARTAQSTERCSRRLCTTCSLFCRSAKLLFRVCLSAGRTARSATGMGLRIRLAGQRAGAEMYVPGSGRWARLSQNLLFAVPRPPLLAGTPPDSPFLRDTLGDLGELYGILVPGEGRVISEPYNQAPLCWGKSHTRYLLRIRASLLGGSLGRPLGPFQERLEMLQLKSREKHGG